MRNGTCPKCNSNNVYAAYDNGGAHGVNSIPVSPLGRYIMLDNYVCGDCGYVEFYISNPTGMEKIKNNWVKV